MNQENKRKRKLLSALGLIVTTIIWGSSFVVMKNSIAVLPPTYLLALRFTLAFTGLYLVFLKRMKKAGKTDWICGGILGVFLFAAYWFQTYGLKYTTASKNAFITTLYVILVPFLHWFFNKKKPGVHNMAAAVIAVFGLALLSLEGDLTISLGDLLTLVSGLFFAFHIVFIDRYSARYDPVRLTVIQIGAAALLGWITAPCLEGALDFGVLTPSIGAGLLYLSIFSTMICFLLQNIGQKYLSPNTSSIILSFESVFGLFFSIVFLGESMTFKLAAGCAFLFASVILSEYRRKKT